MMGNAPGGSGDLPPLSPLPTAEGTRFRVVSNAAALRLQLYRDADDTEPERVLPVQESKGIREIFVPGAKAGQLYTWAVHPAQPLLDPYALAVSGPARFGAGLPRHCKSVVVAPPEPPAWERPRTPWRESVLYEVHVRGFTQAAGGGTFAALASKTDYLRDLGVTAVELLPVHEFDETEVRLPGLCNFWGYSPIAWFAPHRRYAASAADVLGPVREFREMVVALHRAGIEVILDVVFNHTAEMDGAGPTWNLRGLDDELYYLRDEDGKYADLSGTGNTVRAQHPTVRALIRDALRWWVHGMGVDGFRFDLATILARDEKGALMAAPPLIREIEEDPALEGVHLVAEAWDAADGYLVDQWPGGPRWAVWNDRFRNDVRRAWLRGEGDLAQRLAGSHDLFPGNAGRSVNFVTSHDGFTLNDVVSYDKKHNDANGEDGKDGHAHEISCAHGVEGPNDDPTTLAARDRARRNLMASLLLAQGVPMLLAGDELGRTQRGNNNAYCHDSELTWIDWTGLERDADFHRFVKGLIHLRRRLGREVKPIDGGFVAGDLCVLFNTSDDDQDATLPDGAWELAANTATSAPRDYLDEPEPWNGNFFTVATKSLAVLVRS